MNSYFWSFCQKLGNNSSTALLLEALVEAGLARARARRLQDRSGGRECSFSHMELVGIARFGFYSRQALVRLGLRDILSTSICRWEERNGEITEQS